MMIPPTADIIDLTIEDDGTITIKTDSIRAEIHTSAENFVTQIKKLAGGTVKVKKVSNLHGHHHQHGDIHHHH